MPPCWPAWRWAASPSSPLAGEQVILVEDVVSSGGAILNTLAMLRDDGIRPCTALCVIDRQSGGSEALAQAGVTLHALLTTAELETA
jgi:orotate phosphoribosyltransferase